MSVTRRSLKGKSVFNTILLGLLLIGIVAGLVIAFRSRDRAPAQRQDSGIQVAGDRDFGGRSRRVPYNRDARSRKRLIALGVSGGCTLLFLLVGYFSMLYRQDPGEAVVLRSFTGEVIGDDNTSGIGFKAPWVSAISFDIRNQRVEMFGGTRTNPDTLGRDGAAISAGLRGGANVELSTTVRYSIDPTKVRAIYNEFRSETNLLEREIKPAVRDEVRNAAAAYEPYTIKENRGQLALDAEKLLVARWSSIGIIVDGVDFGEILLDARTEEAITAVNVSRQQVETSRNELESSRIQAETIKVKAQAEADSDQIVRCGATTIQVTETIAGKEVVTTKVVPKEGEACEERLNAQVLTTKWLEVLKILGEQGNVTIVIPNTPEGGLDLQPRIDLPVNDTDG